MIEWAETALNVRRKLSQWTVQHGGMIGVFALGAAMGAVLGLEAFDIKLTQGSGEIVGAAIGAGLAIGLGAWLSHSRERRQSEIAERVLMEIFDPLVEAMGALRSYAPSMSSPRVSDIEHYEMLARNISARAVSAETQILALKLAMDAMGLVGASLFFKLRNSAKSLKGSPKRS